MIIKKNLIRIETIDNDLFLFIADLLSRVQEKRPEYLEVVKVDRSNGIILFMSSSYFGANLSRILMGPEQQFSWHNEKEGAVKMEKLPYKVDG